MSNPNEPIIALLANMLAEIIAENAHLRALISKVTALEKEWREDAYKDIPVEYTSRGLERKYLNGDVYKGGLRDCADELAAALKGE